MDVSIFMKPLQGELFRKFRDVIMGCKPTSQLHSKLITIKERVEIYNQKYF